MANVTYSNPTSFRNEIGFKPEGFLGGGLFQEHENDYRNATQADQATKAMSYLEEQNKMKEYALDAPVRSSKRLSDIATNEATAQNVGQIKGGEAADAQVKMQSVKDRVGKYAIDLKDKQDENGQKEFDRHMKEWDAVGPAILGLKPDMNGMAQYEQIRKQFPGLGLSQQFNPQEAQQKAFFAKAYTDAVKKREMEAKKAELESLEKRNKQTTEASIEGHKISAGATIGAARISAEKDKVNKPDVENVLNERTLASPAKLAEYAKKNKLSEEDAKAVLEASIKSHRTETQKKTALEITKLRAANSWMPGSPDKGKDASEIYQEELSKLSGESKTSTKASLKAEVEASGEVYNPAQYDYKVVNGKVYKKAKAKK